MSRSEIDRKFENLISECDLAIKHGKINAVASLLSQIPAVQVPRKFRQSLAKICRRAGLISFGLRLLQPVIRNEIEMASATPGETCEYAVLLSRNGSVQEALELLVTSHMDVQEVPEALTSLAYCHMAQWEYSKVPALLENFLKSNADSYSKMIARLNLASSYLAISRYQEALDLCTQTIELAEKTQAPRVIANCLEVRGQVHFRQNDFVKARADLKRASAVFGSAQSYDQLFISKWQSIMEAIETEKTSPLIEFRQEAVRQKHWESVREADLFTVKVSFDQHLLDSLIFGTSLPAYRERIQEMIGQPVSEFFIFGKQGKSVLDLGSGQTSSEIDLNAGKKIHRVLAALVRDFYVPRNMGSLFADLYPDEYFNINSSPLRVRQLLSRTRRWLVENQIPAQIEHDEGTYRIAIHGDFGIQLSLGSPSVPGKASVHGSQKNWAHLQEKLRSLESFTAQVACEKLKWPRSKFRRVIQNALNHGELVQTGVGRATTYHFQKSPLGQTKKSAA